MGDVSIGEDISLPMGGTFDISSGDVIDPDSDGLSISVSTGFDPTSISDLVVWLDASDTSASNIMESGGLVSQWSDKSGLGNHVTQGTGSLQPITNSVTINSLNAIDFDGVDDLLNNTSLQDFTTITIFIVAEYRDDASDVTQCPIDLSPGSGSNQGVTLRTTFGTIQSVAAKTSGGTTVSPGVVILDQAILHRVIIDGTNHTYNINRDELTGSIVGGTLANTISCLDVGHQFGSGSFYMDGPIGEVIIYDRALTPAEIIQIENYASDPSRWNITLT